MDRLPGFASTPGLGERESQFGNPTSLLHVIGGTGALHPPAAQLSGGVRDPVALQSAGAYPTPQSERILSTWSRQPPVWLCSDCRLWNDSILQHCVLCGCPAPPGLQSPSPALLRRPGVRGVPVFHMQQGMQQGRAGDTAVNATRRSALVSAQAPEVKFRSQKLYEALSARLNPDKKSDQYLLCSKLDHYQQVGRGARSESGRGWACGYRNIQILASALMEDPLYKQVLFGGCGFVPKVEAIQVRLSMTSFRQQCHSFHTVSSGLVRVCMARWF